MANPKITRADWQKLAEDHLAAARALQAAGCWGVAYYVAGYAVECGLKSCVVARLTREPELVFQERRLSDICWSHSFQDLLEMAGLKAELASERATNPSLNGNWKKAEEWSEAARYKQSSQAEAFALLAALDDLANGVMQWTRSRW